MLKGLHMLENCTKLSYVSSLFVAVPLSSSSTVSGTASWSALSHYLANVASRLVWGFVFLRICSEVFSFLSCNVTFVTGCWNSEVQSEAVQTHNSKQVPRGIGVSFVLLPSTFHVSCNNSNSGHSSWLHGTAACSSLKCDERQYADWACSTCIPLCASEQSEQTRTLSHTKTIFQQKTLIFKQ